MVMILIYVHNYNNKKKIEILLQTLYMYTALEKIENACIVHVENLKIWYMCMIYF